jgi:hypothetical protein
LRISKPLYKKFEVLTPPKPGKGGGKDRVRKGNMEWGNDILSRIDGLIASYLGEKCRLLPVLRPIFSKNDTFAVLSFRFLVLSSQIMNY